MSIDPDVEGPTRDLFGHVIRGESQQVAKLVQSLGEQRFAQCLSLCLRIAGYIAIDVSGYQWPASADLREIAQRMVAVDSGFKLAESDVYDYLSRAALGFEPLTDVFPDNEQAASVPLLATATLLVAYRPGSKHWWEYLDVIEGALEEAAPLSRAAFPAALLLSRRARILESRDSVERTVHG
jgi:hypothetical protein